MTPAETARLCKFLKAVDQSMAVDDDTLAAWHSVVGEFPFWQCESAVQTLAKARRRDGAREAGALDPFDVRAEVGKIRQSLLERAGSPCPNVDPDDGSAYRAEARALNAAIMDGRVSPADVARYAGGGFRITAGDPFRAAGEVMRPFSLRQLTAAAGRDVDGVGDGL